MGLILQPSGGAWALVAVATVLSMSCTNGLRSGSAATVAAITTSTTSAQSPPSAYLVSSTNVPYAVGGWVDANIGDTVEFRWNGANADTLSSNFVTDSPDTCTGANASSGPFAWVANSPTGSTTLTTLPCQAGRTYTYYYQATNSGTATTAQAVAMVHVIATASAPPQGTIRADRLDSLGNDLSAPVGYLDVNPGESIKVTWNGNGGTATSANVSVDSPDTCGAASIAYPQILSSTSGTTTQQIGSCSAGHYYTVALNVTRGTATAVESMLVVHVRPNPTLPAPTATLNANGSSGTLEIAAGQTVTFQWGSTNADQGDSTATMTSLSGATVCDDDLQRGAQPTSWNALGASGTIQPYMIPACKGGHTYTITFTAYQTLTGQSASATLTLQVDPQPGS